MDQCMAAAAEASSEPSSSFFSPSLRPARIVGLLTGMSCTWVSERNPHAEKRMRRTVELLRISPLRRATDRGVACGRYACA